MIDFDFDFDLESGGRGLTRDFDDGGVLCGVQGLRSCCARRELRSRPGLRLRAPPVGGLALGFTALSKGEL